VGIDQAERPHVEGRSLLPILDEGAPAGWDRTYFSHCFHEVTNYFPYRVIREDRYKYIRHLAWQLPQPLPTDLFRSPTWQAVLSDELETMGVRETAHFLHRDREELYDLEADPHETTNRIDDPALADVAERLRRECLDWRQRTDDLWLEVDYQEQVAGAPDGGP
jgi:N-sulfoglucosamine sulfohydrolase